MAVRERRVERASWLIRRDLLEVGAELRAARLAAGLTLREVAASIGLSQSMVLKTERGRPPGPRPEVLAAHAAAVGMRARLRVYPDGEPFRDAGQLRLAAKLQERLAAAPLLLEQPVTGEAGDQRAFDAVLVLPSSRCAIEFISRFHDCQAQLRQINLKRRDGGLERLIVVVAATKHNRRALNGVAVLIQAMFPLGTKAVLRALSGGRDPGADGIVLL